MGQQLVQAAELFARAPAFAGFACLVVQGFQKSPWGVELTNRNSSSGPQVHALVHTYPLMIQGLVSLLKNMEALGLMQA